MFGSNTNCSVSYKLYVKDVTQNNEYVAWDALKEKL
jgi:hypothetical protein